MAGLVAGGGHQLGQVKLGGLPLRPGQLSTETAQGRQPRPPLTGRSSSAKPVNLVLLARVWVMSVQVRVPSSCLSQAPAGSLEPLPPAGAGQALQERPRCPLSLRGFVPRPVPSSSSRGAPDLPMLPTPEPAVLQYQLVGRLGGARQTGGRRQGQRQGEGQQPHEERHGAGGHERGAEKVRRAAAAGQVK